MSLGQLGATLRHSKAVCTMLERSWQRERGGE